MNKEYLYLSDKEILVIDEKGHAVKRNVYNTNMHDVLLLENNLEKINEAIIKLEKIILQNEESKLPTKAKIILAFMPFVVGMTLCGLGCVTVPSFSSSVIPYAIGIALSTITIDVAFIMSTKFHTKHISGIKSELSTAYQLKQELEQKLSNIKDTSKDSIASNIVQLQENSLKINDIIVLEETTPFCEEASKQLEDAYMIGYEQKVKRLILKK